MSALPPFRRVVTGIDAQGRSCIQIDGPPLPLGGGGAQLAWRTEAIPADNSGAEDCPAAQFSFDLMNGPGSLCMVMEFAPDMQRFFHATDTIDYVAMLSGAMVVEMETGEVTIRAGDVLVQRGVQHCWRNDSGQPARAMIVSLPSHPVGPAKDAMGMRT